MKMGLTNTMREAVYRRDKLAGGVAASDYQRHNSQHHEVHGPRKVRDFVELETRRHDKER